VAHQKVRRSPDTDQRDFFYGYIVVAASFCIFVVMYGTRFVFGVFFKPMITEFGWTRALTSGALSLSMVVQGLLAIVMGGLSDRLGPRIVLTLCGFLLGLGCLLMSQINTLWQIYLFYGVIIGLGMSGVLVPLLSTIARWFNKRRNVMTGIALTGIGLGSLIAPPVAHRLISRYDWRISYIILGCLVLGVGVLAAQFLKRDPMKARYVPYRREGVERQRLQKGDKGVSLREAAHTRQFWMVFGIFACLGFSYFSIMVHIVPHITDLGISAARGANILAALGAAGIVGNILGGAADRIGNKVVCVIGLIFASAMLFWLVSITEVWMFYLFVAIFGIGYGVCITSESPLVAWLFGVSSHGLLLGIISFGFTIGAALGPLLTGYIFDATGSYHVAFLTIAVLSVVGLVLMALISPIGSKIGNTG
jgi:MFS family permease